MSRDKEIRKDLDRHSGKSHFLRLSTYEEAISMWSCLLNYSFPFPINTL